MANSRLFPTLICVLIIAATLKPTFGIIIDNHQVTEIRVAGQLSCSSTGNLIQGLLSPPLVGANVTIVCNGGAVTLGQVVTDVTGTVSVVYRLVDAILFDSSTCVVRARLLNVLTCTLLPPTRILGATLVFTRFVQDTLGGVAAVFNISPFVILA